MGLFKRTPLARDELLSGNDIETVRGKIAAVDREIADASAELDRLALRALHDSAGTAIAVSDADLLQEMRRATRLTGILWSPEGAATIAGVRALRASGWLAAEDEVVLLNTGSGLKTLDLF